MADVAMKAGEAAAQAMAGGKRSAWMVHVKKTMRAHKGMKLAQVLKMAKKTYKKGMKGGFTSSAAPGAGSALPVSGGRRRGSRKTRGSRKH